MKHFLFAFLLFVSHTDWSQDAAIELVEQSILYRGYDNLVRIAPSENGVDSLLGTNATITQKENGD